MTEISIRVETIGLAGSPTSASSQISTPNSQGSAKGGSEPLETPQRAAKIGDPVPIVFGRRVAGAGGVLISPAATEARFTNNSSNDVTASYLLVLSEGELDGIQVRDVFQQSCRVGTLTQAYNRRAGSWAPGNFITTQTGFEDAVPNCPLYCGSGTGGYAGVTTGSFVNTIPHPFTQWDQQVHAFVRGGMHVDRLIEGTEGPSNNIADLVLWLLRRTSRVPEELIDQESLLAAAQFAEANGLWCNIEIKEPSNLADWYAQHLGYFLLRESRKGGKRGLRPLLPQNNDGTISTSAVPWIFTFTEDHVLPESMEISYSSRVERQPFCVRAVWRQQPEDGLGLARTAEVRYGGSALEGPYEQHDLSAFCTTEDHALKVGAYILARRRYIDHRVVCSLRPGAFNASLSAGDIVRLRLERVASVGEDTVHDYLYEVDRVGRSVTGEIEVELTHFPVDDQGRSLVALDVTRAEGNGILLPTGRAAINCDINADDDETVPEDPGPWPDWDPEIPDPEIYPIPDPDDPDREGWIWDPELGEWVPDPDVEGWVWDEETQTWIFDPDAIDPDPEPDPKPEDAWPDGVIDEGDGWGPGVIEQEDISAIPDGDDVTAAVTFSQVIVSYPEVWYAILDPAFAGVRIKVTVDTVPVDVGLQLRVTDGIDQFTAFIPAGETTALLTINGQGASVSADTTRTLSILEWSGGHYQSDTTTPVDISATQSFTIKAYVGVISLQTPGVWTYSEGDWSWVGSEETGDFGWDVGTQQWAWTGSNASWDWDAANQRWDYNGSAVTGWSWQAASQRWLRTLPAAEAAERPDDPPTGPISPIPSEPPAEAGYYTIVAQATVDKPPLPNDANDLTIGITDISEDQTSVTEVGDLVIPAVSMTFGAWRWNPATSGWEYPSPPSGWAWIGDAWEWRGTGADVWSWDTANEEWTGPTGETPPDAGPPTQNGSTFPPDAERWTYNGSAWSGTAQASGGSAPDFTGLLVGRLTYHMPLAES